MKTKTITIYNFNELNAEAKAVALDTLRDINTDYDWYNNDTYLLDSAAKMTCEDKPFFSWGEIYFDLDRNWYLQFVDLQVANDNEFFSLLGIPEVAWGYISYQFSTPYMKNNTKIALEIDSENELENEAEILLIIEKAEATFSEWVQQALQNLDKEHEYQSSPEAITETILANNYEFLENGKLA